MKVLMMIFYSKQHLVLLCRVQRPTILGASNKPLTKLTIQIAIISTHKAISTHKP
jgi:hypothetical protein